MTTYIPPRVTFIGSDPKIPALRRAIHRVARTHASYHLSDMSMRFIRLWQARNRRTRVLMWKVRNTNEAR